MTVTAAPYPPIMPSWNRIETEAPELAAAIRARFGANLHKTLATLRIDGSPRISGTEVVFADGDVWLGSMPGAMKAKDLLRDGRCAIHSAPVDDKLVDGDAKLAGVAHAVTDLDEIHRAWPDWEGLPQDGGAHAFCVDITEVVLTTVADDALVATSWHPDRGVETHRR